jgi:hypothetical protein
MADLKLTVSLKTGDITMQQWGQLVSGGADGSDCQLCA